MEKIKKEELTILWTNSDPFTACEMVLLYALNAKRNAWWDEVTVLIWGGSAKLITEDQEVLQALEENIAAGVHFTACKKCTDDLGVSEQLEALGIELKYWGVGLTQLIKSGAPLLSV